MKRQGGTERGQNTQSCQIFSLRVQTGGRREKFNFSLFVNSQMQASSTQDNGVNNSAFEFSLPQLQRSHNPLSPMFKAATSQCTSSANDPNIEGVVAGLRQKENSTHHIMLAKPTSQYCHVCKTHYTDYLNHIKRDFHHQQIVKADKELNMSELMEFAQKGQEKSKRKVEKQSDCERKTRKFRMQLYCYPRIEDQSSFLPIPVSKNLDTTTTSTFFNRNTQRISS